MPKFRFCSLSWELLDIFSPILYMHWYWQDLPMDCYTSFFWNWYQSYIPLFTQKFRFRSISWEQMDRISPNFIHAFILTRSSLGLLHNISDICTRVMALDLCQKLRFRSISWEQMDRISPKFIYAFILTRSSLGMLHVIFWTFVPELWPLIYSKILFLFKIVRTSGQNFTKFDICIHIDKIYIGIVTRHFSHNCTRVMALDLCQKFVSAPLSWEQIDRISPNFIYAFILTRSTMGLLHIIFCTFVPVLWPLIYAKISSPFNILRTNGQNFTKFYICIHIDKIYVGIITHLYHWYGPWFTPKFCFRLISWEGLDRISPNFI